MDHEFKGSLKFAEGANGCLRDPRAPATKPKTGISAGASPPQIQHPEHLTSHRNSEAAGNKDGPRVPAARLPSRWEGTVTFPALLPAASHSSKPDAPQRPRRPPGRPTQREAPTPGISRRDREVARLTSSLDAPPGWSVPKASGRDARAQRPGRTGPNGP